MKPPILIVCIAILSTLAIAGTCGNSICESTENHLTCGQDCRSGGHDYYCDRIEDGTCDPDCIKKDPDCADYSPEEETVKPVENSSWKIIVVTAFLIISTTVVLVLYHHANKGAKYYEQSQIDRFTNIRKQERQDSWAHESEQAIMDKIKQSEDFQRYAK